MEKFIQTIIELNKKGYLLLDAKSSTVFFEEGNKKYIFEVEHYIKKEGESNSFLYILDENSNSMFDETKLYIKRLEQNS